MSQATAAAPSREAAGAGVGGSSRIDAIVPTHDSGEVARACLHRLAGEVRVGRILVVDAASRPAYLADLRRWCGELDGSAEVLAMEANRGFAAAVNLGLGWARSEFVLLLNPDCLVQRGSIDAIVEALAERADCGLAGGLLVDASGREQRGARRDLPSRAQAIARGLGLGGRRWDFNHVGRPLPPSPVRVPAVSGAFMLARRDGVLRVGGMDEGFFLHFEDLDWCRRFAERSLGVLFVPGAVAVHEQGSSSRSRPFFVRYQKHRSMIRFDRLTNRSAWHRATHPVFAAMVWSALAASLLRSWRRSDARDRAPAPTAGSATAAVG